MSHRNGMGSVPSKDPLIGEMLINISKMDPELKYGEKYKVISVDKANFLLLIEIRTTRPPIWCYMNNFITMDEFRDIKLNNLLDEE